MECICRKSWVHTEGIAAKGHYFASDHQYEYLIEKNGETTIYYLIVESDAYALGLRSDERVKGIPMSYETFIKNFDNTKEVRDKKLEELLK